MNLRIAATLISLLYLSAIPTYSQDAVKWSFSLKENSDMRVEVVAEAEPAQGWYIYDTMISEGGPNPTTIEFDLISGAEVIGEFKAKGQEASIMFDETFQMEIGIFNKPVKFVQLLRITDRESFRIIGNVRAQACDGTACTPPLATDFSFDTSDLPKLTALTKDRGSNKDEKTVATSLKSDPKEIEEIEVVSDEKLSAAASKPIENNILWKPVIEELSRLSNGNDLADASIWDILLKGLLWGLAALLTPCVWPMIPITVSFFLNRNKDSRRKAVADAVAYGVSIILIYVSLGLIITAIFGAGALNNIATSPIFNLIFFALLVTFAFSFMGSFELVLPSSWTNKADSKVDSTKGWVSLFFMAFTLALVSFSCTGPIIGWLLVDAATHGNLLAPAAGMFGFALALSIPFALFAIFPSWLKRLPKSGSWLNSVKVFLGFIVLAVSLKFLSVADLSGRWGILNRDIFLALWITIFMLLGLYLLGKIKFKNDSDLKHISLSRLTVAIFSFAFAIYLIPGLWGAPLKPVSSILPPLSTQDFKIGESSIGQVFDDYDMGMTYAAQKEKPVLLYFGGHGCVNCHKMDAVVLADEQLKKLIDEEYIFIALMVDERTRLEDPIEVREREREIRLRTVGDKWSYLQRHKFGTQSQPFYVVLNHRGEPISPPQSYDEDPNNFIEFLQVGLRNFNNQK